MLASLERTLCRISAVVIILCAWAVLLLLLWNINRGFDLTDEANLLYLYRHPDAFLERRQLHHFGIVRALVPPPFDHVLTYRVIKLIGFISLTPILAIVLSKWVERHFEFLSSYMLHPIVLAHFMTIGSFLAYCHGSQTLSYNDVITFCLLGVAIVLLSIDLIPPGWSRSSWNYLVSLPIGGILVLAFFTKWSSSVLLTAYYCLFVVFINADRSPRAIAASLVGALCGVAMFTIALTDAGFGTKLSFSKLFTALADQASVREHGGAQKLLLQYVEMTANSLAELLRSPTVAAVLVLPLIAVGTRATIHNTAQRRFFVSTLGIAILVSLVVVVKELPIWVRDGAHWFNRFKIADPHTFAAVFAALAAWFCLPAASKNADRRRLVLFLSATAMIATLPAVGAIGTNNALLTQFIRHMGPLFAVVALLAAFLSFAGRWRPFAAVVCAAMALLGTAQLYSTLLLHPYRLARPGIEQTVAIPAPHHMAGLRVDADTHAFISALLDQSQRAAGSMAGVPMLAMFDLAGVVYILDAVSVGYFWHYSGASVEVICDRLLADPNVGAKPRLITLDRDLPVGVVQCLRRSGLDIASYIEVADIQLAPRGNGTGRLRLLVPRGQFGTH
jgi:hypothetical protein